MHSSLAWKRLLAALLLALPLAVPALPAAGPIATVTIADGEATLLRATTKLALAEGVRLGAGDMVETAAATRLLRVEFDDGLLLDLGPATRLQLMPRLSGEGARRAARLYLLQGWAKLTAPKVLGDALALTSPALDLRGLGRNAVLAVEGGDVFVFAEAGDLTLLERSGGRAGAAVPLKGGEFYERHGDAKAATGPRPTPAFLKRVPKAFVDSLPARAAQFAGKDVAPKALGAILYADAQPWIDAEPALRGGFVPRWRALARQSEFRRQLQDTMAAHPEWDPVLNPEKYLPKPASAPASALVSPGSKPAAYPTR